ncbi:MAG: prepilin peptidase [Alphaproteobacteria bacterium]|nr:prepilin peptidase [Alphaproteobacteria bacterium]
MIGFYLVFLGLSFCVALSDLLFFRIPNSLVLALLGLFILKSLVFPDGHNPFLPFLACALTLIIGYLLYAFKIMGAGDVKFLSVASLWAVQTNFISFMLVVVIAGGILALVYLNFNSWMALLQTGIISLLSKLWGKDNFIRIFGEKSLNMKVEVFKDNKRQRSTLMPYGVAIFCGCCFITAAQIRG